MPSPLFSFLFQEVHLKKPAMSLDDSDIEARLNSWNLGVKKSVLCMYIDVAESYCFWETSELI